MSKKSRIIILSIIILFIISSMLYITYGYVTAEISGNETSKKITSLSQVLKVEYSGGTNELLSSQDNYFVPGSTLTKTFSIKNVGNQDLNFSINLNNITNDFTRPKDLVYELYLGEQLLITDKFPEEDRAIAYNQSLNIGNTSTYTLKIIYLKSEENQIEDQGKIINASIDFIEQEKMTNIKILGNSIQDGTPSIETPIEIQSVGEKSNNLFPYTDGTYNQYNVNLTAKDGTVTIEGTTSAPAKSDVISAITFERITNYRDYAVISERRSFLLEAGTYTFTANQYPFGGESNNHGVALIVGNLGTSKQSTDNPASIVYPQQTFTLEEDKYCMPIYFKYKTDKTITISKIQLEKSDSFKNYIPQNKYLVPVSIQSKNLANLEEVESFVKVIQLADNNRTETNIYMDDEGNRVLKMSGKSGNNAENYSEISKIFKGPYKEKTQYTLSFKYYHNKSVSSANLSVKYTDGTTETIANTLGTSTPNVPLYFKGVTKTNKTLESIQLDLSSGIAYIYIDTLQLEEGTEVSEYEPYRGFSLYLDEPLRKVGSCTDFSCMDYIDLKEQKIVRNVHRENINAVEYMSGDGGAYNKFLSDIEYKPLLSGSGVNAKGYAISNKFMMSNVKYNELSSYPNVIQSYITTGGVNRIAYTFSDNTTNTIDLAQTQIGDGFEVNYIMASPIYEDIQTTNFYSINPASNINVSTTVPATVIKESNN